MRNLLCLLLFLSVTFGQVNDKNFKSTINGGMVVAVFTSEWQEQPFDKDILKGVSGYQDCEIIYVESEQAKKATKKAASKSDKKAEAKTINVSGAAVSKTQTSREPISSDPQDVIKIGSDGPKSPRRGWWSRS